MPHKALAILEGRGDWATMPFEAAFLTGEALRTVGRHRDALKPLETAAALRPGGRVVIRQLNSTLDIPNLGPSFEWEEDGATINDHDRSFFYRALHLGRRR